MFHYNYTHVQLKATKLFRIMITTDPKTHNTSTNTTLLHIKQKLFSTRIHKYRNMVFAVIASHINILHLDL